jgi:hypothetical protein
MLSDHVSRSNSTVISLKEKLEALRDVYYVLCVYGLDCGKPNQAEVLKELKGMQEDDKDGAELAISFVEEHYGNVACLGTSELRAWMVPAVLPFAQLVQALPPPSLP